MLRRGIIFIDLAVADLPAGALLVCRLAGLAAPVLALGSRKSRGIQA